MVGLRTGLRGGARARGATAIATFFPRLGRARSRRGVTPSIRPGRHRDQVARPAEARGRGPRSQRQKAGVSLEQMAKITHRDPSTLSRFERGLSAPRDLDAVVAAYQGLEGTDERAIARAAHAEREVRRWPPVYVALVAVVALVALATHAQDERGRFQRAEQLTSCLAGISCLQRGE